MSVVWRCCVVMSVVWRCCVVMSVVWRCCVVMSVVWRTGPRHSGVLWGREQEAQPMVDELATPHSISTTTDITTQHLHTTDITTHLHTPLYHLHTPLQHLHTPPHTTTPPPHTTT